MKIYKIALSVQDAARVNQREKLAFKDLFAGNLRVIIPLQNNELLEMVNLLESGDTESETKYKVDIEHNLAYRIKDGELDPRPMRPGKVIKKELGQTWADEWSRQVNSTTNKNYSIILSRSPIDVARMSDHDQINSCHSPGESYFPNAIEEAKDGGAIAYVVDNEDVAEIAKAGLLQSEEIFEDRNRGVSGISPLSRIRINRYVEEDDDTIELAVPVTRSYGDSIAGFLESTTRWLYDKQQSIFDYKDLETDLKNFIRTGGAYADINDSKLFENFFGSNMGVRGDLESRAGTARVDMFNEEFHEIEDNIQLKHCQIGAEAEVGDGGYISISASANIIFQIYGVPSEKNLPWQRQRKALDWLKNNISIMGVIEDMYFNFHEETGITSVEVRVFFDEVQSPDDFRMVADELERFDKNEYNTIFNGFLDVLIADNLISRQHVNFGTEDYENYFSEQGMVYDKDDKEIVLWITVPFDISEYFKSGEKEKLREIIEESFQAATKQRLKEYVDSPRSQQNYFEFVKNDPKFDSPLWRGMIPIPSFEIYFNTLMDNPSKFAIDIPDFEVMRLGKEYFDIYAQVLPFVVQDIVTAIQSDQFDRYEKYEEPIEPIESTEPIELPQPVEAGSWYSRYKYGN